MKGINCIFIKGGGLTTDEADALYFFGQQMIKRKLSIFRFASEIYDTEIVITTEHKYTFFVGVGGIKMNAEVSRGSKTITLEFLVYPTKKIMIPLPGGWRDETASVIQKRALALATQN
jgi:hypothetical protein